MLRETLKSLYLKYINDHLTVQKTIQKMVKDHNIDFNSMERLLEIGGKLSREDEKMD